MADYPTLHEMGIPYPETIDRYSLQTVDNHMDLLRIVYKKQKGSILPDSKRFRFPRTEKFSPGDGKGRENEIYYEISPVAHKAMAELDQIVRAKRDRAHQLEVIKEEIQRLKEEASTRIEYLSSLVSELE
jgi:hypothetical protein